MKTITKLASLAIATLGAAAAQAQQITYITLRGSSIYQVIPGSGTGGRYVNSPRSVAGVAFAGYTDRVARGELYATLVTPAGHHPLAPEIGYTVNGQSRGRVNWVWMPWATAGWVSLSPFDDNVEWYAYSYDGGYTKLRLPIGTRP